MENLTEEIVSAVGSIGDPIDELKSYKLQNNGNVIIINRIRDNYGEYYELSYGTKNMPNRYATCSLDDLLVELKKIIKEDTTSTYTTYDSCCIN
jgi:hypothetical protein